MASDDPRRETNPLFNDNAFKLGVFGFNGKGAQLTFGDGPEVSWARSTRIATMADDAGFEAIVPYTRWKGRPQVDEATRHVPHEVFDTYAWAAGTAQATRHGAVFSTTAVPIVHPIVVAKQAATIDHISGGRFALNVVAGWNAAEFEMFGEPLKSHDDRYDQAVEWMEVLRKLWTEEEFDFEGRYYKIVKGESWPKPLQRDYPAIMNAGGSDKGAHFATKYADLCFVMPGKGGMDDLAAQVAEYKRLAREEYGRTVQVWTVSNVIVRDSAADADDETRRQAEMMNPAYIRQLATLRGEQAKALKIPGRDKPGAVTTAADGAKLIGTPGQIVDKVAAYARAGIDGVLLQSDDLDTELPRWREGVMPLLEQAGLRAPLRQAMFGARRGPGADDQIAEPDVRRVPVE